MKSRDELIADLKHNTLRLKMAIREVPDYDFNTPPKEGAWSVAGILEHLFRSEFGIPKLFKGEASPVEDRPADAKVAEFISTFVESDKKYQSFEQINPTETAKNKEELLGRFVDLRDREIALLQNQPLDEVCHLYPHPIFGHLTRYEWAEFNIIHTQRHLKQIEETAEAVR